MLRDILYQTLFLFGILFGTWRSHTWGANNTMAENMTMSIIAYMIICAILVLARFMFSNK